MRKIASLLAMLMLFSALAFSQTRTVTGVIKDEKGDVIAFATVLETGTKNATRADIDGNFTIKIGANSKLTITAIGHATQTISPTSTRVEVSLQTTNSSMTEVVVTSLGIARSKKGLGYGTGSVNADKLSVGQSPTLGQALSGKVPGLTIYNQNNSVTQDVKVVLRGYRSITQNNEALIVLDGVPVPQNTISYINPADIETVTVLKGGQAATLYGSDGVNGALMITTKKGRSSKPTVNFTSTISQERINIFPEVQTEYGSGSDYGGAPLSLDNFRPFENQQYGDAFDGQPRDVGRVLQDGSHLVLPYAFVKDQKKNAFDKGYTIANSVSVSSGDGKGGGFFMSVSDGSVKGVVPGDVLHRDAFRFNASRVYGKFKAGFDATYNTDQISQTSAAFYFLVLNTPGEIPLTNFRDWRNNKFANPNGYFNDYYDNPYFAAGNNRVDTRDNYLNGSFNMELKATNWLTATYRLGTAITNTFQKSYTGQFLYTNYASKTAPTFDPQFNDYNGIYRARTNVLGGVSDFASNGTRVNSDLYLTAEKKFKDLSAKLIVGNSIQTRTSKNTSVNSASIVIPDITNVNNTAGVLTGAANISEQRKYGFYGDLTLGWKDYLFLHGSVRNDHTSLFFDTSRPSSFYSYTYYGTDASFVLTDAFPSLKSKTLSFLKLRASYSFNRNDNISPYSLQPVFNISGGFPYGTTVGLTTSNTYPDASLKPERVYSMEGGLEFGLLNNAVNVELSYYKSYSKDNIISAGVSTSTGYSNYLLNSADMNNHGFEADVKATVIKRRNFKWDVNANYSYNTNRVTSIFQGLPKFQSGSLGTSSYLFAELKLPFPYMEVSGFQRDPNNGAVIVDDASGTYWPIKDAKLRAAGNTLPKHIIGFGTTASFKGFTLSTNLEFRTGYTVFEGAGLNYAFSGSGGLTNKYGRKPFVWPNSETYDPGTGKYSTNTNMVDDYTAWYGGWGDVGSPTSAANIGEFYAISGRFLKVRDISIGYSLPQSLLEKTKFIKSVTIAFIGRNLFTFLPKENIFDDPEFNAFSTSSNNIGISTTGNTPASRSYGVSLNVNF